MVTFFIYAYLKMVPRLIARDWTSQSNERVEVLQKKKSAGDRSLLLIVKPELNRISDLSNTDYYLLFREQQRAS